MEPKSLTIMTQCHTNELYSILCSETSLYVEYNVFAALIYVAISVLMSVNLSLKILLLQHSQAMNKNTVVTDTQITKTMITQRTSQLSASLINNK